MIFSITQAQKTTHSKNKPQNSWTKYSTRAINQSSIPCALMLRKKGINYWRQSRTKSKNINSCITFKSIKTSKIKTYRHPSLSFCRGHSKSLKTRTSGFTKWKLSKMKRKLLNSKEHQTFWEEVVKSCNPSTKDASTYRKIKIENYNIRGSKKIELSHKKSITWAFIRLWIDLRIKEPSRSTSLRNKPGWRTGKSRSKKSELLLRWRSWVNAHFGPTWWQSTTNRIQR